MFKKKQIKIPSRQKQRRKVQVTTDVQSFFEQEIDPCYNEARAAKKIFTNKQLIDVAVTILGAIIIIYLFFFNQIHLPSYLNWGLVFVVISGKLWTRKQKIDSQIDYEIQHELSKSKATQKLILFAHPEIKNATYNEVESMNKEVFETLARVKPYELTIFENDKYLETIFESTNHTVISKDNAILSLTDIKYLMIERKEKPEVFKEHKIFEGLFIMCTPDPKAFNKNLPYVLITNQQKQRQTYDLRAYKQIANIDLSKRTKVFTDHGSEDIAGLSADDTQLIRFLTYPFQEKIADLYQQPFDMTLVLFENGDVGLSVENSPYDCNFLGDTFPQAEDTQLGIENLGKILSLSQVIDKHQQYTRELAA